MLVLGPVIITKNMSLSSSRERSDGTVTEILPSVLAFSLEQSNHFPTEVYSFKLIG